MHAHLLITPYTCRTIYDNPREHIFRQRKLTLITDLMWTWDLRTSKSYKLTQKTGGLVHMNEDASVF